MMKLSADLKENLKAIKQMFEGFKFAREQEVLVGIPEDANGGHSGGITNAKLLYIHCNGSPANNIPPRPVLEMGVADPKYKGAIEKRLSAGMRQALQGNIPAASASYTKAGMLGQSAVQAQFGSGMLEPNKPRTVARKKSSAPLIDTGALRQAITFVVRKRRK